MPIRKNSPSEKDDTQGVYAIRDFPKRYRLILRELGRVKNMRVGHLVKIMVDDYMNKHTNDPEVKKIKEHFSNDSNS